MLAQTKLGHAVHDLIHLNSVDLLESISSGIDKFLVDLLMNPSLLGEKLEKLYNLSRLNFQAFNLINHDSCKYVS